MNETEFSDVTVVVGHEAREFKLHRIILSTRCPSLKNALKKTRTDTRHSTFELPNMEPEIFEIVVKWAYEGYYKTPGWKDMKTVQKTYKAANSLGMDTFKRHIIKTLMAVRSSPEPHGRPSNDPFGFLSTLFEEGDDKEWRNIKTCTEMIPQYWSLSEADALVMAKNEKCNREFLALLAASYSDALDHFVCAHCCPNSRSIYDSCICCGESPIKAYFSHGGDSGTPLDLE